MHNVNVLEEAVMAIASYGFIIAPGFIFGFDSDTDAAFDDTLKFLADSAFAQDTRAPLGESARCPAPPETDRPLGRT